jgi:uncharacterized protein
MKNLLNAIWENDAETVKKLLSENTQIVNEIDENGRTMLSWAAQQGNLEIVKILLRNGAEINSCDSESMESPLHNAIIEDNIETALYLIDNGADLKMYDVAGRTPLHVLANKKALGLWENGCDLIVDKILEHGVEFDRVSIAAALGTVKDVKTLIDSGCDVDDFLEFSHRTALQIATFTNNKEMLKYILSKSKFINWVDYENNTAIDIAKDDETISQLRNAGAESNVEIMDSINRGQQDVRAFQNLYSLIKKSKKP